REEERMDQRDAALEFFLRLRGAGGLEADAADVLGGGGRREGAGQKRDRERVRNPFHGVLPWLWRRPGIAKPPAGRKQRCGPARPREESVWTALTIGVPGALRPMHLS